MTERPGHDRIDYFNTRHLLRLPATQVALWARQGQWRLFLEHFGQIVKPTLRVLDLGATPDERLADSNLFARKLAGHVDLTLSSPEDCRAVARSLGARFVPLEQLQRVPLGDTPPFDVVVSIAVIEHVGSEQEQRRFARFVRGMGRYFFVTSPNRWFPVEFHTFLPVLHWLPKAAHRWILRRLLRDTFWSREQNLNLLGREILEYFRDGHDGVLHRSTRLAGWPSNHILIRSPKTLRSILPRAG
jgi:hypothetical protein